MNQHLQTILTFIQQARHLTDDEKAALTKAAKDADKEIEITAFKLDRTEKVKRTTAILLEETIEELENKRKAVEAQNRKLEIEASLERVRTVAMSMSKTGDLLSICEIMFTELKKMGFHDLRNAMIDIHYDDKNYLLNYDYSDEAGKTVTRFAYNSHPIVDNLVYHANQSKETFTEIVYAGKALEEWRMFRKNNGEADDARLDNINALYYYFYSTGTGAVGLSKFTNANEEQLNILKRFRNVFDLAYKRYLDIEKAEARAREAQIETALERVRAVAMAMKQSHELTLVCEVMYKELLSLGFHNIRNAQIAIENDAKQSYIFYVYSDFEKITAGEAGYNSSPITQRLYNELGKSGDGLYEREYSPEEMEEWRNWRKSLSPFLDAREETAASLCWYMYSIGKGNIGISTFNAITKEQVEIVKRFKKVFELSYTRFDDLQKAEAQMREAQIEAALEKVRSRSLAMHTSDELRDVVGVVFKELQVLNFSMTDGAAIIITFIKGSKDHIQWIADTIRAFPSAFKVPYSEHPLSADIYNAKENGVDFFSKLYSFEEKNTYFKYLFENAEDYKKLPDEIKNLLLQSRDYGISVAFEKNAAILIPTNSGQLVSESEKEILKRFAKVFEQAYVRFLDLQKAEAQAREGQIQLALERVRARTMAMHHSSELAETSSILFQQIKELGFETWSCGFCIWKDDVMLEAWMGADANGMLPPLFIPYKEEQTHHEIYKAHEQGLQSYHHVWQGQALINHYTFLKTIPSVKEAFDILEKSGLQLPALQCYYVGFFKQGYLLLITTKINDELKEISRRFAKVFDLTYTRFLDLQKAEAQAREAQIEAALEKVRSRSLAMHRSDELKEVIAVMFQKASELNVLMGTIAIWIFNTETNDSVFWVGNNLQQPSLVNLPFDEQLMKEDTNYKDSWQAFIHGESYINKAYNKAQKDRYFEYVFAHNDFNAIPPEARTFINQGENYTATLLVEKNSALYFDCWNGAAYSEESIDVLRRIAKVFEQAYVRFLDLQKSEAQSRESQIQLALERVRARTMAMQKSNELAETAALLFSQFKELGYAPGRITIGIMQEEKQMLELWATNGEAGESKEFYRLPFNEPHVLGKCVKAWKEQKKSLVLELSGKPLEEYTAFWNSVLGIEGASNAIEKVVFNFAFFSKGYLGFISFEPVPTQTIEILERFAGVFDLTYTRFLDLEKAEAQTREAQIELSLERVRAKTMAMHNSADVGATAAVMVDELKKLGIETIRCGIGIMHEPGNMEVWTISTDENNKTDIIIGWLDMHIHPLLQGAFESWRNKNESYSYELKDDDLLAYYNAINSYPGYPIRYDVSTLPTLIHHNEFAFTEGILFAFSLQQLTDEQRKILKRFAGVFGQTYRRYLDLKKAEAQARESKIEAALERVRAVAMSMMKSEDLMHVCEAVYKQLTALGFTDVRATQIYIRYDAQGKFMNYDYADATGGDVVEVNYNSHANTRRIYDVIRTAGDELVHNVISATELDAWKDYLYNTLHQPQEQDLNEASELHYYLYSFGTGAFGISSFKNISDDELQILKRFRNVFSLSYQRYSDIALAEAQAREAQVEAALERVRTKTMAMRSSDDIAEAVTKIFDELLNLGVSNSLRCGISIFYNSGDLEIWTATTSQDGKPLLVIGRLNKNIHPLLSDTFNEWENKQQEFSRVMYGEDLKSFYDALNAAPNYPFKFDTEALPAKRINNTFFFPEGALYAYTDEGLPEEARQLFKRFAKAFSLTYRRYFDLQKAEAQAREAQVEAALERVRSRTLAMQHSSELAETSAVLFKQLMGLGISPHRLYISILKNDEGDTEFWITDEDGSKVSMAYEDNLNNNPSFKKMYEGWQQNKKSLVIDMKGKVLNQYLHYLESIHVPFKGGITQKRRLQYIAYFSKGFIGMAAPDEQPAETLQLLERFAYVFNLTFTRFNDLQLAEAHALQAEQDLIEIKAARKKAEDALSELQVTQRQLIQSEKMASLGELTAGIAHEIQNPLNFVNNFSEVNNELIEELKAERSTLKAEEQDEFLNDIFQNNEKIALHGKRADAIVKGMLQHSRKSSGIKEPTDINALCDEYLRLSYHGLRAKDKSFNADFKTDFDETIGKINIVPQDIGRVLLNLFNNAFYAVNERKNLTGLPDLLGLVTVQTKKINDNVEIRVEDNGNGISSNIIDKIFQPFFTTKPTGQGTGLGLSLAYDIITKEHNGTIKVESKEGEGSKFIINLPVA